MDGKSLNIKQDQLDKLKSDFPEVVTEGKIDWEKLQVSLGRENAEFNNERYVLNWAGKSEAFRILQQPTTATLISQKDESINFENTDNIFIEGENLEVLKVLQKSYYGKIKCIIIDPPYNTGSDSFIYPDSFKESKEDYKKRIGDIDEEGYLMKEGFFRKNSKDSGHYHSNWLSMMYPRLFLAKNLMKDDGIIFIHIDDNEVYNLRLIMNEIFGEENFISQVIIETATDNNPSLVSNEHEYLLVYSKNRSMHSVWRKDSEKVKLLQQKYIELKAEFHKPELIQIELRKWIKKNKHSLDGIEHYDNVDENGIFHDADIANPKFGGYIYDVVHPGTGKICKVPEKGYRYPKETLEELIKKGDVMFGEDELVLIKPKKRLESAKDVFRSVIYNDGRAASKRLSELIGRDIFRFPKDEILEKRFLEFVTSPDDIILDFFAGSGTIAESVLEMNKQAKNRKFILIQLPEPCEKDSEAFKAGFKTIADISKERIRRVIQKIEKEKLEKPELFENSNLDLGFQVFKLSPSNFKIWHGNEITEDNLEEMLDIFTVPAKEGSEKENMFYELLLKSGYLLTDKIELKEKYYSVCEGELIVALEEMSQKLIENIIKAKQKKVITLDSLFVGNDQLKTNTVLQMKDAEIDLKTI